MSLSYAFYATMEFEITPMVHTQALHVHLKNIPRNTYVHINQFMMNILLQRAISESCIASKAHTQNPLCLAIKFLGCWRMTSKAKLSAKLICNTIATPMRVVKWEPFHASPVFRALLAMLRGMDGFIMIVFPLNKNTHLRSCG